MAEGDFLSAADLLNFNKQVQSNSLPGIASQAIGSWAPDMTTWSPTAQGIGSFGKTFLSALLGNYARQDASDQLSKVVSVLPQLGASPNSVAVPEGVDADAFNVLKGKAALSDMMASVLGKQQKEVAKNKVLGEFEAYGVKPVGTITGSTDAEAQKIRDEQLAEIPGTPQFERNKLANQRTLDLDARVQDARDFLEKSKTGVTFSEVKPLIKQVTNNLDKTDKASDLSVMIALAKANDPVGAVSDQTIKSSQDAIPYLEKAFGSAQGFFDGKGYLTRESKLKILEQIAGKVNAIGAEYSGLVNSEKERLRILGADPNRLSVLDTTPFDMKSVLKPPPTLPQSLSELSGIDAAKAEFARNAKASGMSIDDARKAWAQEEKRLLGGVSAASADILNMR